MHIMYSTSISIIQIIKELLCSTETKGYRFQSIMIPNERYSIKNNLGKYMTNN